MRQMRRKVMIQKTVFFLGIRAGFFNHFSKFHLKILLDINATVGRENIFKPTIWNKSLHEDSNDYSFRIVNFET